MAYQTDPRLNGRVGDQLLFHLADHAGPGDYSASVMTERGAVVTLVFMVDTEGPFLPEGGSGEFAAAVGRLIRERRVGALTLTDTTPGRQAQTRVWRMADGVLSPVPRRYAAILMGSNSSAARYADAWPLPDLTQEVPIRD